ncbi:DinB family protein [Streptomyces decoyicus]|uniref:DinB family protein n=1 Tax=Streptomyces decoyicus TaxID=249567 RepID=UPI0004AB5A1D|nr:DinB family protein [Streptomyces decoyicus]KOG49199.1 Mini-circle protein [Streptomyces decoyicus]QZY19456.1 DinB family protein [Streptomyces decoyicus]
MVHKIEPAVEPPVTLTSPSDLLTGYLDFYREAVLRKVEGMSDAELRNSRLPTGWSPLGLFKHLACVELRWLQWGFNGEHIEEPWADFKKRPGPWHVDSGETFEDVKKFFQETCARSRAIVAAARLEDRAATLGGKVPADEDRPTLIWILFHLLQEYARHVGHLDIARELADGAVGE